ncbi:carotenoid 1,2-hydratase [Undibacterium sp.]|jgi:predicted secreted hydrolase|uniref:lipocalin-like domain-containing protein n=1 Tax=Undibacterium sp. TaxID=1914977 RepID=UPI002B5BDD92|nr:carotenoid 1,2-hydratase [Undibacterium sp.]HTD06875.1 carotenoid 1,2-hydratase [Undibacterium sp.]
MLNICHRAGTRARAALLPPIALAVFGFATAFAQAADFAQVNPGTPLSFPQDYGAHPDYRTEWWYATGWLETPDKKPLGFQVTFFRSATGGNLDNPSKFAAKQLIIAHAALSDPALGKLLHDQKSAREGFGLAYAKPGNTDVKLDNWTMQRDSRGNYQASIVSKEFTLKLTLSPSQPLLVQGEHGYSQKGTKPEQASYYYSEPQLKVSGAIIRAGKETVVNGSAWLDHEWSSSVLDNASSGWDWLGANLEDGGALMAFQIRDKDGKAVWAHATLRDATGKVTQYAAGQVRFVAKRRWTSAATNTTYPVATAIELAGSNGEARDTWDLLPLSDNQELDSRRSTGAIYWEGAVTVQRNGRPAGRGYLELTGYNKALKL